MAEELSEAITPEMVEVAAVAAVEETEVPVGPQERQQMMVVPEVEEEQVF
jgi:hypothetical protein